MSLVILHSWEVIKFESADQYQAHACLGLLENKPQIKAPRVTSLQSRASGGRIHVCPRRAYVGTKSRSVAFGVGVYTYALRGIGVRGVENPQGFGIDERRFANWAILLHPHPKIGLCTLCVLCGEIKICTAKSAKNAKGVESMNVLLSIKPKYVEEILNGNKKYEFRKSIFKCREELEMIYIYSSSPVKKIVGAFVIENIIEDHPEVLWAQFKDFSGINDEREFFNYFGANKKGFAIKIGELKVFKSPADPRILNPDFVPPQSFCYIDENFFRGAVHG